MPLRSVVFWLPVAIVVYTYVGYPLLLACIAFVRRNPAAKLGYTPMLSLIIPVYNESVSIRRKLVETLALNYPSDKLEVVVVSDGSTDETEAIVSAFEDPRVRLLKINRAGKTHAQNEAVKYSTGEILVFSDATSRYDTNALLYLASHYTDPQVGAVSGRYLYVDPQRFSPMECGAVTFWKYENIIKFLQSRIYSLTGCSGCIYSVKRDLYVPLSDDACSDLLEPLHIIARGRRVVFEHRALASEETTSSVADEFLMRIRVATHGLTGIVSAVRLLSPVRHPWVFFQLISHKLLRWAAPFCLLAMLVSAALPGGSRFYRWALLSQLCFYFMGVTAAFVPLHRYWRPLGIPLYFCTLNAAALISVVQALRGHRYVVWNTARS